ncbi:MAG: hypothetical protein QM725_00440 [Lacibacter sp.]
MNYRFIILPFLTFIATAAMAQYKSGAMHFESPVEKKDSNSISFAYNNLFYFKDYEYFNKIQTGYTLFGTWHYPRIVLQPNKWLRMEGGSFLQKDYGDKQLSKAIPVFSIQVQHKYFRVIMGALEGNQTHQLTDALMSYDNIIERPLEEGMQLIVNTERIKGDLWLDWKLRQKENANYPEELTPGLTIDFALTKPDKKIEVKIPVAFIMPHKGGQLDTNRCAVVGTSHNYSFGIAAEINKKENKSWIKRMGADLHYVGYHLYQRTQTVPYNFGDGFAGNFFLQSKWDFTLSATYWNGCKYIAPIGNKLYQSISYLSNSSYTEQKRKLLLLNLIYEKEVYPGFFVDARYSPYVDMNNNLFEHSFLILFSYRTKFKLGKIK